MIYTTIFIISLIVGWRLKSVNLWIFFFQLNRNKSESKVLRRSVNLQHFLLQYFRKLSKYKLAFSVIIHFTCRVKLWNYFEHLSYHINTIFDEEIINNWLDDVFMTSSTHKTEWSEKGYNMVGNKIIAPQINV